MDQQSQTFAEMNLKRTLTEETTGTSRLLILNSEQAQETRSATDKVFQMPPHLKSGGAYRHKLILKSFQIAHVFRNQPDTTYLVWVPDPVNFPNIVQVVAIPPGNWSAHDLANFLTRQLGLQQGPRVFFDKTRQMFVFVPQIYIDGSSTCNQYIGVEPEFSGAITVSHYPVDLVTLKGIIVNTNLAVHNLPINGIAAYVPVPNNVCFGGRISYYDFPATDYALIMDEQISRIHIKLLRQDGRPLDQLTYAPSPLSVGFYNCVPPWTIVFKVVTILNEGFVQPLYLTPTTQTTSNLIDSKANKTPTENENPEPE